MTNQYHIKAICFDKKGKVLSVGYNNYNKTHPIQKHFAEKVGHEHRVYLHAEIDAILKAKGKHIHRIHIERKGKDGTYRLAKPCPVCYSAIHAYGIKEVTYTLSLV